eukprot:gene14210-6727_t
MSQPGLNGTKGVVQAANTKEGRWQVTPQDAPGLNREVPRCAVNICTPVTTALCAKELARASCKEEGSTCIISSATGRNGGSTSSTETLSRLSRFNASSSGEVGNGDAASPKKKKKKKKKNATAKKEAVGGVGGGEGGAATKPAPAPATPATPKLGAGAFSDSNKAERDAAKRAATTQFGDEVVSEIVGRTGEMHGSTFSEGSVQGWRASQEDAYIADSATVAQEVAPVQHSARGVVGALQRAFLLHDK